jgi:hypothetical protein
MIAANNDNNKILGINDFILFGFFTYSDFLLGLSEDEDELGSQICFYLELYLTSSDDDELLVGEGAAKRLSPINCDVRESREEEVSGSYESRLRSRRFCM